MRPTLLLLLGSLSLAGVAIAILVASHFVLIWTADWVKVDGRIIESKSEWSTSKFRSGFCYRIKYAFSYKEREFTGTGLRPGLVQDSCSLSATVGGVLVSGLKVGQPIAVFVDNKNNTSVLDRSPLVLVPIVAASIGLLLAFVGAWGVLIVRNDIKSSSNRTVDSDARKSSARGSP